MLAHRLVLLTTSAAALALSAGTAHAATYCVDKPACSGLDTTFDGALANAAGSAENDRIEIGETTIAAALHLYDPANDAGDLEIIGAGPTKSIFLNKAGVEQPTLRILRGPGGNAMKITRIGLRMTGPDAAFVSRGIRTGAVVEDVEITTTAPQPGKMLGIELDADGVLRDSTIKLASTVTTHDGRVGVFVQSPGTVVERSTIDAVTGLIAEESLRLTRVGILARGGYGVLTCRSAARIDNSLIRFQQGAIGVHADTFCPGAQLMKMELRQVTLRGDGSPGSPATSCAASNGNASTITLRGSIVDGAEHDIKLSAGAGGTCDVGAANSRIDLADRVTDGAGTKKASDLGGNTTVSPGFVNPAGGDFRLKADSSMLDVGTPGAIDPSLESTLDLIGKPRNVASKGFGTPRRDMGAYEFQPNEFGVLDPNDPQDPKPQPPLGLSPTPKAPPVETPVPGAPAPGPGQSGGGGATGTAPTPPPGRVTDRRAPKLAQLKLTASKRSLRKVKALRRKQRAGATLRLVLDETATVSVVLERKVGKRWVRKGALSRKLVGGRRAVAMRSPLRRAGAGSYRLRVRATDAAGNRSALRTLGFKVTRR